MVLSGTIWAYGASAAVVLLLTIGLCLLHRLGRKTACADYAYGATIWSVTVAAKFPLAMLTFGSLHILFGRQFPLVVTMLATGLLTGATECVGTFFLAKTKRWRMASWDSVVAFGLAFGCFEAAILAVMILLASISALFSVQLRHEDAQALIETFSDPYRPLTFFLERSIAIPVHLLSSVLIIRAVQVRKISLFWWGFLLKSLIDAVPSEELSMPMIQGIYVVFGLFSFVTFHWYSHSIHRNLEQRESN